MHRGLEPNRKGKIKRIVTQIVNKVRDEGKVSIAKLALELGYNPHYMRYAIIPAVLEIKCIEREGNYLIWICTKEEDEIKKIIHARPTNKDNEAMVS